MAEPVKPKAPVSPLLVLSSLATFLKNLLKLFFKRKKFWITGFLLLALYIGTRVAFTYVPPNMIGVRQVYYGGSAGISAEIYEPGLHFIVGGLERLHMFPSDLQVVNFSDSPSETSAQYRSAPAIKIQTSDGYNVTLDVTVLYHISDAHKILVEVGPGRAFEDRLVVPNADRDLRRTLGELNSEEFYKGPRRIDRARAAEEDLRAELAPKGLKIDAVLVRRYSYDDKYQQLIESRKITDQTKFLNEAQTAATIEEGKRDSVAAEGKALQETELARGRGEIQKLHAAADLYTRQKRAEGGLLVETAEAEGTRRENQALQGAGSENMVGLKMAEVLAGVKVLVLPSDGKDGMNPLDLSTMLKKFEVK